MRTLVLVRHAKAEPTAPGPGGDHERRLEPRGRRDATVLGQTLREVGLAPDLAVVSTGVRAVQTLEAMLEEGGVETWPARRVYDGGVDGVLEAVREVPDHVDILWVVGHEPVMSTTAWELADEEARGIPPVLREEMSGGMPTATAAVLELDLPWSEVALGCARLVGRHTGRSS
ncbi:Phosphohistidine phosphatase SixA [Serinicoccus hydrothermalis]|uniref:Phosphohistidine phosphatase SixA n=1 Tax=Serinicoccus hydrothermalis TaxID=1758689 RepID=A0A1B1NAZ4_9MICO|nr:histidine phosphatase family protein [Serinicoccus hydrothermalis]ANS78591.1 Phosphohistidine phosphatase SixA [Serinicoccus hydrothermalis]